MGAPFTIQNQFGGMYQDTPRDMLPVGRLWNIVDFIPEYLGSPVRKRGGWTFASLALAATTYVDGLIFAPFAAGSKNLAVGSDGHVYDFTTVGSTDRGTAFAVAQNPIYHRNTSGGLVVIPAASGTNTPKSYDGTTFQDLAGTPPQGIFADVWNDRTLLANGTQGGTLFQVRLWFGPVGNAAGTWDTTNSWLDTKLPIRGLAAIRTGILIFHDHTSDLLTGTTPPSATTIGDLTLRSPVFDSGLLDARSIAKYNDTVIWADERGIYQTDGNTLKSLTADGGMSTYWRNLLVNYTASWTIAGGVYNDTYIVSLMNGSTFVDCLAYDLQRTFWYRLSNVKARCFSRQPSATFEETYYGGANVGRVSALSPILTPAAGNKADGDGTAVAPYFETELYRGWQHWHRKWVPSMGIQSWRRVYLNYQLTDAASDAPTITVSYATDPAATYTPITATLPSNSIYTRLHRDLFFQGNGLMLKVAQTGPSADTRLHGIECEYSSLEESRLVQ